MISNNIYKNIVQNIPVMTVDILLISNDKKKILLFKRENKPAKKLYYTSGGRLHKNELMIDCCIRKTKEELGINIKKKDLKFCGIVEEIFNDSIYENVNAHFICGVYLYIFDNKKIKLDNQHSLLKWFNIDDINLHENIKNRLNLIK